MCQLVIYFQLQRLHHWMRKDRANPRRLLCPVLTFGGALVAAMLLGAFVIPRPPTFVLLILGTIGINLSFASMLTSGLNLYGFTTVAISTFVIIGRIASLGGTDAAAFGLLAFASSLFGLLVTFQWAKAAQPAPAGTAKTYRQPKIVWVILFAFLFVGSSTLATIG